MCPEKLLLLSCSDDERMYVNMVKICDILKIRKLYL